MYRTHRFVTSLLFVLLFVSGCGGASETEQATVTGGESAGVTDQTTTPEPTVSDPTATAVQSTEPTQAAVQAAPAATESTAADAETDSCQRLIDTFGRALSDDTCAKLQYNWACYGHDVVKVEPDSEDFRKPGDRQQVTSFSKIDTESVDGTAVMHLLAGKDESSLQVLAYGDSRLTPLTSTTFKLLNPNPRRLCDLTPSGVVVRTEFALKARLQVNGVEIEFESAAFLTMLDVDTMVVANMEGTIGVSAGDDSAKVPVREQIRVTGISTGQPRLADSTEPSPYFDSEPIQWLANDPDGVVVVHAPETLRAAPAADAVGADGGADSGAAVSAPAAPTPVPTACVVTCPAGWAQYRVSEGDTLTGLQARTIFFASDLTVDQLREINCIPSDSDVIQRDALICVPAPPTATAVPTQVSEPTERRKVPTPCLPMVIGFDIKPMPYDTDQIADAKATTTPLMKTKLVWNIQGGCDPIAVELSYPGGEAPYRSSEREGDHDVVHECPADFTLAVSAAGEPTKTRQIRYEECESSSAPGSSGGENADEPSPTDGEQEETSGR